MMFLQRHESAAETSRFRRRLWLRLISCRWEVHVQMSGDHVQSLAFLQGTVVHGVSLRLAHFLGYSRRQSRLHEWWY